MKFVVALILILAGLGLVGYGAVGILGEIEITQNERSDDPLAAIEAQTPEKDEARSNRLITAGAMAAGGVVLLGSGGIVFKTHVRRG